MSQVTTEEWVAISFLNKQGKPLRTGVYLLWKTKWFGPCHLPWASHCQIYRALIDSLQQDFVDTDLISYLSLKTDIFIKGFFFKKKRKKPEERIYEMSSILLMHSKL